MTQPVEQPPPPDGLAALVSDDDVRQHLLGRTPHLLSDPAKQVMLKSILRGVGAEVAIITGPDPQDPQVRELALWAIGLGAAARIESSLFPEQQFGEQSRAQQLTGAFLGICASLTRMVGASANAPRFSFPPPPEWPR